MRVERWERAEVDESGGGVRGREGRMGEWGSGGVQWMCGREGWMGVVCGVWRGGSHKGWRCGKGRDAKDGKREM